VTRPTLLFYCQHSLGLGHLHRSLALSESLSERFRVVLLCGGRLPSTIAVPAGVELVALPPLGASADGRLLSHDRRRSLTHARRMRRDIMLETFHTERPDAVLIEFFPFGKKRFADELIPLLEEARDLGARAPLVACSIRDILVSRGTEQAEHDDRASDLANRFFDAVLVHSDPDFARLEESFRPRLPMTTPIHYTGFVVSNGVSRNEARPRRRGLVVSAGGGVVGGDLLESALGAHRLLDPRDRMEMNVIAGPFLGEDRWRSLRATARVLEGVTVRRSVPDLGKEMHRAAASVSQCGYNTALDILRSGVPALVVPFSDRDEDEQTRRAVRLRDLGLVRVLESDRADPHTLAEELRALRHFRPRRVSLDMEGASKSVRILAGLMSVDRGRVPS
jgi:predicted glycosyltransferase